MDPNITDPHARPARPARPHPAITPPVVVGVALITLGSLLMVDRLDIVDAGHLLRFWPAAFILVGIVLLIDRRDTAGRVWGGFWIFLGTWFLLRTFGIVRVGLFELLMPGILLLVGMRLLMQAFRGRAGESGRPGDANLVAILSETKRASHDNPFRGGYMNALMGGCQFDLRQATIAPGDTAVIEMYGLMCGHEIWVPPGWTVESNIVPIMAGVEDKRLPAAAPPPDAGRAPRLVLRGYVLMSGVTIKN